MIFVKLIVFCSIISPTFEFAGLAEKARGAGGVDLHAAGEEKLELSAFSAAKALLTCYAASCFQ